MRVDHSLPSTLSTDHLTKGVYEMRKRAYAHVTEIAESVGALDGALPRFPDRLQGDATSAVSLLARAVLKKDAAELAGLCSEIGGHGFASAAAPLAPLAGMAPWLVRELEKDASLGQQIHVHVPNDQTQARNRLMLAEALGLLEIAVPDMVAECKTLCSTVHFVDSAEINSSTSWETLGSITIRSPATDQDFTTVLENVLHESAHLAVYSLAQAEPIVTDTSALVHSPFRGTARPIECVAHAAIVMRQLMVATSQVLEVRGAYHSTTRYHARLSEPVPVLYAKTVEALRATGCLSELGDHLLEEGIKWLQTKPKIPI